MKELVSKIKMRLNILRVNTVNTFQGETAYFGNNWGNVCSTFLYTVVQILFVQVLYSQINTFAGYDKNQMYFLLFVSQLGFYTNWTWGEVNHRLLIEDVRRGILDFLLVLPVPSLWYVTFRKIPLLTITRDALPNMVLLAWLVDWAHLPLMAGNVVLAVFIFILGVIAWESFCFLLLLPVFWHGESKQIYSLCFVLRDNENVPWEGYRPVFQFTFSVIVPTLLMAMIPVSVALGKVDGWPMLGLAVAVTTVFVILKNVFWKIALKNYTSAS